MPHQSQNHQPDLGLQYPHMSRQIQQLLSSTRNCPPADLIQQVHDSASRKYRDTKKEKQQELSSRIREAHLSGDKAKFKNAKKKVDNHASSVASRFRRAFLISTFETLVRSKMEESARLAEVVLRQNIDGAKKDADIQRMQLKIATLTKQVESLSAQVSKNQSNAKSSPLHPTRDGTWNPGELRLETIGHSSTAASASADPSIEQEIDHFSELGRADISLGELEEGSPVAANPLTSYLARVAPQTRVEGSQSIEGGLKIECSEWGPTPFMILRDAQAQMKADAQDNVLFPAV